MVNSTAAGGVVKALADGSLLQRRSISGSHVIVARRIYTTAEVWRASIRCTQQRRVMQKLQSSGRA
jgi:hypothetical protein